MAEKMSRCVIIGASPYSNPQFIRQCVSENDFIICADGGLDTASQGNILPAVVIGDFDSLKQKKTLKNFHTITLPKEKDDTDSFSCLKYGMEHGYREFVLLGMTGGRIDHTYANLHLLKYLFRHNGNGVIQDDDTEIYYTETEFTLHHYRGKTVSVLPFGCEQANLTLSGFQYKAENLIMHTDFPIGISNIVSADISRVMVHEGGVLIIVNR